MDSRTHLDYVLFQLTPTRTRCDLVIFAANKNEKLASGLLEPFLSHLKSAKDQISKGGYSVTLRPTSNNAPWFTKATLERFVRFVSTPEVLERFVTIEREITQIEDSILLNEQANGQIEAEGNISAAGLNPKGSAAQDKVESNGSGDATQVENSKVHLLRALETRRAVLRKEQAMAYARALVAGFEMDYIDDLISFSDAFGAKRLREACNNFMELCNKKSDDGIWMDEVAAMQAFSPEFSYLGTSGIIIAGEGNDGGLSSRQPNGQVDASDSTTSSGSLETKADNGLPKATTAQSTQVPPWAQYMHNFQGPPFQQFPPYQGYFYPGMQVPQSYFPGNVPWPSSTEDSSLSHHADENRKTKSFSKNKDKVSNERRERRSKHGESNEPSHSSSASDSEDYEDDGRSHSLDQLPKKSGKSSSRKVVIRNINYITSKRSGERDSTSEVDSSDEDGFIDADSLKQQVDEALGSFDKRHRSTSGKNRKRDGIKKHSNEADGLADKDIENISTTKSEGEKRTQEWDAFQNLLMKDAEADSRVTDMSQRTGEYQEYMTNKISGEEKLSSFNVEAEIPRNRSIATDAFLLEKRSVADEGIPNLANFEDGENVRAVLKRGGTDDELLLSQRVVGRQIYSQAPVSDWGTESSIMKSEREEDWFAGNRPDISGDHAMFNGDDTSAYRAEPLQIKESNKDVLVDDSFMIQAGPVCGPSIAEQKTDIFLEADIAGANLYDNSRPDDPQDKIKASNAYEPDDLYMVLGRDSAAEEGPASWNPEMDYNDNSIAEAVKKQSDTGLNGSIDVKQLQNGKSTNTTIGRSTGGKVPDKQVKSKITAGSLGRSKSELLSKTSNTPARSKTMVHRGKVDQEEVNRKKMEELRIQRQKRIAERSSTKASPVVVSRMTTKENKKATVSPNNGETKLQASIEETKKLHKPVFRSSTIDRLSAARTSDLRSSSESKVGQTKKATTKESGLQNKKVNQEKLKLSDKKTGAKDSNGYSSISDVPESDDMAAVRSLQKEKSRPKATPHGFHEDAEEIKELENISSIEKNGMARDLPVPTEDHSAQTETLRVNVEEMSKASLVKDVAITDNYIGSTPQMTGNGLPSTTSNIYEDGTVSEKLPVSPKVTMSEISTPPLKSDASPEYHSRKKWNDGETSPKISKGFRKLLLFGRKS